MTVLRNVLFVLAVGILGLVAWRAMEGRPPPPPSASRVPMPLAALEEAMRAPAAPIPALAPPVLPPSAAVPPVPPPSATVPPAATPVEPTPSTVPPPAEPTPAPAPAVPAPVAAGPTPGTPVVATAEERIAEVPEFASFYGRLRADFPREYGAILGRLGGPDSPSANAVIWDALRDIEQSNGILAAQAGAPALDRFFDARSAMLDGLAPLNARQCVDFLYGVTDAAIADFTAAHQGLVATLADRTLDAIADGRAHHLDRPAPTTADLDALSGGLASRGLSSTEIGLLIDGTTPDPPLPDTRICAIGRTYLDVLHGLPAETRQRIYGLAAELLARS